MIFDKKAWMKDYHKKYYQENKEYVDKQNKKYYEENKKEVVAYKKEWYNDNKDKILKMRKKRYNLTPEEQKRNSRLKQYGINFEDYDRMFIEQNGCCAICGKHQTKEKKSLHVDHNHKTGKIRGLLCQKCNHGVGLFNDNLDLLKKAIEYLDKE